MKCKTCGKSTDKVRSVIHKYKIYSGCDNCLASTVTPSQNDSAKYDRDRQREDFRADIVQPFEGADYIRARGIEKAREMGYSDEDIRKLG